MTETLGDNLPKEITRVRRIQDNYKELRNKPGHKKPASDITAMARCSKIAQLIIRFRDKGC